MPLGKKIKMYYDPRGQAIKTVNPDNSLQTVFFGEVSDLDNPQNYSPTPWVSFSYDANDNAQRRSSGGTGLVPSSNFNTPKSAEIDALGRTIKTTEHDAHYNGSSYVDVVMEYSYDIRGNQLKVTDPNGRSAFDYKYDYANRNLWTSHIDSGVSSINMDVMGKPIEAENAKGGETLSSYDILNRPIRLWAKDESTASFTLRQYPIYGDDLSATGKTSQQTKDLNLYGQGWKLYDEAGMVHTEDYDFKGNLLEKTRQVIKDSELLSVFSGPPVNWQVNPYIVDWTGLPTTILDSQQMVTTMTYDALNRAMNVMYPDDVNGNRKILTPTYNKAGIVKSVDFDGTEYIKEIAYDAKGQPLLTAYGNDIMTRYAYDENTFRVERLKSEKYVYSNLANTPTYAPQSGSTKQDFTYEYDLVGNIMKLHDRTPDCGINGSTLGVDALDKIFNYDPLYRVISASGRESTNQNPNILWGTVPAAGSPNANNAQAYTKSFQYDKLGNMEKLQQTGNNAYTRNYVYSNYANDNKLSRIEGTGSPAPVYSNFSYDVNGNMTSSDLDRGYIWDAADQLRAFSIQAGTSEPSIYAQYLYSGGQRVKKIVRTTGGDYEVTVYDGAFEYMKKVSGGTTYEKNYTHIEGAATVRTGNGTNFPGDITDDIVYNLGDNIGSINVRLSITGTLIDREEYYPFGDTSLRTFVYKRYRYVNKQKDSESGLYYYGARYYASWTCRFISVDPLAADFPFYCSYQYAGNKPINSTDINGMAESGNEGQGGGGDSNGDSSTYTVKKGDSLWKISEITGVSINDIVNNPVNKLYFQDENRKLDENGLPYIHPKDNLVIEAGSAYVPGQNNSFDIGYASLGGLKISQSTNTPSTSPPPQGNENNSNQNKTYLNQASPISLFNSSLRIRYTLLSNNLKQFYDPKAPNTSAIRQRTHYKLQTRNLTIGGFEQLLNKIEGPVTQPSTTTSPRTGNTVRFYKTNMYYNILGYAGFALSMYGVYKSVERVANAENKPKEALKVGAGWGGAWLGMKLATPFATEVGLALSPEITPFGGMIVGGLIIIGGGMIGGFGGEAAFDAIDSHLHRTIIPTDYDKIIQRNPELERFSEPKF